jgi:hypothetical protein
VEFVGEIGVVTGNRAGQLVMWKLPDAAPQWVWEQAQPLALSPGGNLLAVWDIAERCVRVCDSLTGQTRGTAEFAESRAPPEAAAFSNDGAWLAGITNSGMLQVWDMTTGELAQETALQMSAPRHIRWFEARYLLVDQRALVDRENAAVIWKYQVPQAAVVEGSFDGNFWFVSSDPQKQVPGVLLGQLAAPSEVVKAATGGVKQEDRLLLCPGRRAAVSIAASVPGVDVTKLETRIKNQLIDNGVTIDPAAPVRVVLSGSQSATGKTLKYEDLSAGKTIDVPVHVIRCALTISDDKGRKWEQVDEMETHGNMLERGDVATRLPEMLRSRFEGFAGGVFIPRFVYPMASPDELGSSQITLRGEIPVSAPPTP